MRLILVRHGETDHNRGQITLGRADVPLNAHGEAQAAAVASSFRSQPDAIVSSPLQRALVTAQRISEATSVPVSIVEGLIEMDVGEMEHLATSELRERYPEFLGMWMSADAGDARMPGGETLAEVQERSWAVVGRLREAHPDGLVVAVTHNFVILTVVCRALAMPLGEFRRMRPSLAAKTVLDIDSRSCRLLQLNDNAHLVVAGLADDLSERGSLR